MPSNPPARLPDEADASMLYQYSSALPGVEVVLGLRVARLLRCFHTAYGLATPLSGGSERVYRGRSYECTPGTAMITVPGEAHAMTRVAPDTRYVVVRFSPARMRAHAEASGLAGSEVTFDRARADDPELAARVRALGAAVLDDAPALLQQEREGEVLTRLLARHAERTPPALVPSSCAFVRARERLLADLSGAATLAELADAAGVNKVHVGRLFKRSTGMGPHAFLLAAKLARARELLQSGETAGEVAVALGFTDQSHLTRHFKHHFGVTPSRFGRLASGATARAPLHVAVA